uniref:Zinc finger protein 511 n=1 Tax=Coturnix japonica TaxID=93934 RepID=A0A8C2TRQ5_COTJA
PMLLSVLRRRLRDRPPLPPAPPPASAPPRAPFAFCPRRLRLDPQHPLLEDGDVHRHLYLREALTGRAEEAESTSAWITWSLLTYTLLTSDLIDQRK